MLNSTDLCALFTHPSLAAVLTPITLLIEPLWMRSHHLVPAASPIEEEVDVVQSIYYEGRNLGTQTHT